MLNTEKNAKKYKKQNCNTVALTTTWTKRVLSLCILHSGYRTWLLSLECYAKIP